MPTATKNSYIQIKVDPEVKASAARVAEDIGMNLSTLINVYLKRVAAEREIPFILSASDSPNRETYEACEELDTGGGKTYASAQDFFSRIGV